jgi:hypothetical protein
VLPLVESYLTGRLFRKILRRIERWASAYIPDETDRVLAGWGFAQFNDGKPADKAMHQTCFRCHEPVNARDFVFTRYAP